MVMPPATFFWLGALCAFAVVTWQWRRYYVAATKIRAAAQGEGGDWPFMRDAKYMALFTYAPEALLEPSDSDSLRAAKEELLRLRAGMWRAIALAISLQIVGIILAIGWSILREPTPTI